MLKFFFSLNFHPLYSSTQRDGTFGKIILSSTPTCDHNFKSRNLLSSCGENKGPGSDLGPGEGEAAWGHRSSWGGRLHAHPGGVSHLHGDTDVYICQTHHTRHLTHIHKAEDEIQFNPMAKTSF